ncbi:hypothetical protein ACFC08_39785, partial [Streptomyces sp. NPDC056112]|uniref:hypothetical protein n=1 Tax=Streptomyces sp. NPDC056112 TaxID=3345715 RepID=UPI0035E15320
YLRGAGTAGGSPYAWIVTQASGTPRKQEQLTPEQADPSEVLRRHKGQGAVERRYGDFKGPLAVTPVFVQDNRHVAALIAVI